MVGCSLARLFDSVSPSITQQRSSCLEMFGFLFGNTVSLFVSSCLQTVFIFFGDREIKAIKVSVLANERFIVIPGQDATNYGQHIIFMDNSNKYMSYTKPFCTISYDILEIHFLHEMTFMNPPNFFQNFWSFL